MIYSKYFKKYAEHYIILQLFGLVGTLLSLKIITVICIIFGFLPLILMFLNFWIDNFSKEKSVESFNKEEEYYEYKKI